MWRVSRTRRQLLRSQRKGRVESRSWLLPTDRLPAPPVRVRSGVVGRSYRNANQLHVRGQIIRLMRSNNRGRWLRATAASPRAGSEKR